MLSLEDVRSVSFRKAKFGGYKPEDVDAFIDDLQISYEEILHERDEMIEKFKKMKSFVDKLQAEDISIKDVISNARNIVEKSLSDAEFESQSMIANAAESSKKMIEKAKKEVSIQSEIADRIKSESSKMKEKLANIYKSHMELINSIPGEVEKFFSEEAEDEKKDGVITQSEEPKISPEEKVNKIIKEASSVDIFSEPADEEVSGGAKSPVNEKFKNLEFGENYNSGAGGNEKHERLYNGIFEK